MPNEVSDEGRKVRHARNSVGDIPGPGIAQQLSELARELQAEPDMAGLLDHIVASTVAEVDGADFGGISLLEGGAVSAVAATAPLVKLLDERQNELGEGPCMNSLREHITVRSDNLAEEERWPAFVAAAMSEGIRSMLSVQLFVEGDNLGALNLYATKPYVFGVDEESTAMALAAHAAVAVKGSRMETHLRAALGSRDVIGQGKGILMERFKINADEAFKLLVLASQHTHLKLRDVAAVLADTGELRVE